MRSIESIESPLHHESINADPVYFEFHSKLLDIQNRYAQGDSKEWPRLHQETIWLLQKIESALKKRPLVLHPDSHQYQQMRNLIPFVRDIEQKINLNRAA